MFKNFKNLGQAMMDLFTSHPNITEEQKLQIANAAEADIVALVPEKPTGDGRGANEGENVITAGEGGDTVESLRVALAAATTEKDNLSAQLTAAREEAGRYKTDADEYNKIKAEYKVLSDWHANYQASVGGVVTADGNGGEGKKGGGLSEATLKAQEEKERLAKEYPGLMDGI